MDNARACVNVAMAPENAAMITNAHCSNGIKGAKTFVKPGLTVAPEINPPADAPAPEIISTCARSLRADRQGPDQADELRRKAWQS